MKRCSDELEHDDEQSLFTTYIFNYDSNSIDKLLENGHKYGLLYDIDYVILYPVEALYIFCSHGKNMDQQTYHDKLSNMFNVFLKHNVDIMLISFGRTNPIEQIVDSFYDSYEISIIKAIDYLFNRISFGRTNPIEQIVDSFYDSYEYCEQNKNNSWLGKNYSDLMLRTLVVFAKYMPFKAVQVLAREQQHFESAESKDQIIIQKVIDAFFESRLYVLNYDIG